MTEQRKHTTRSLTDIKSLRPQAVTLLMRRQGISSAEMLLSLSTDPAAREGLKRLLGFSDDALETVLNDARSLFDEEDLARLMAERNLSHKMGALLKDDETSEGNEPEED